MLRRENQSSFLLEPFQVISACRRPLWSTLVEEVRRKYAGSAFGLGWVVLVPVLFLALYSTVYLFIYKVKPADITPLDYTLLVYIGLLPYLSFVESFSMGAGALVTNRSILLNTVFPAEMLPLRAVLAAQTTFVVGAAIVLVWLAIDGRLRATALIVPYIYLCQVAFLIGVGWFLAPIYVVFRDLGQIINFLVLLMLVVSPIAFRASELKGAAAVIALWNPLYYFLISYQSALFDGILPSPAVLVTVGVLSATTFLAGFRYCKLTKQKIADYV